MQTSMWRSFLDHHPRAHHQFSPVSSWLSQAPSVVPTTLTTATGNLRAVHHSSNIKLHSVKDHIINLVHELTMLWRLHSFSSPLRFFHVYSTFWNSVFVSSSRTFIDRITLFLSAWGRRWSYLRTNSTDVGQGFHSKPLYDLLAFDWRALSIISRSHLHFHLHNIGIIIRSNQESHGIKSLVE